MLGPITYASIPTHTCGCLVGIVDCLVNLTTIYHEDCRFQMSKLELKCKCYKRSK